MDRAYYAEYRENELNHWWFQGREVILRALGRNAIGAISTGSVEVDILNIGAMTGRSSELLSALGKVTSIEIDAECVAMARAQTTHPIRQGSVTELADDDASFDLVTAFDVIEHLDDDALAIREMMRVCKPGGVVFVTVPALPFLWGEHDEVNHHRRRYYLKNLVHLIESQPMDGAILQSGYFNFWLLPFVAAVRFKNNFLRWFAVGNSTERKSDFARDGRNPFSPLLRQILASEAPMLKSGIRFPWGASAFALWKRVG